MANQATISNDRSRTYWTPTMERYFIDLMLDQVHKGNRVGYTFNKQAWTDMLTMFNAKFGSKYYKDVLKGRYKNLWEQYNDVKILLEQSGFAWDETRQMVIAADHVWDSYVKAHPDIQSYKTKPVLNYNDLRVIYGYTTADGRYSRSSHDIDLEDDILGMKIGKGSGSQNRNNDDRNRTNWSPTMDRYFVDLMLEQLHKGNKIENTFNKQAWTEMILFFNENFESKYNKNVLRSRYKILRKHYNDMKVLLGQSGFDLDELRQMVVADDCVWDAYIKAHPDARSCRTTSVPDYKDLCMIYGDEIAEGRKTHSVRKPDLDNDIMGTKIGEQKDSQTPISCDRSRTYWTPPMDRYFIDLMLDQVLKGNKIDNTFIAQAWIDITTLFNAKFGSQHDKEVLKNRYKSLRKQYTDIKILLEQNGFTWDETRQMVRADDNIWDAYIKVHPDARSYRIRIVPNYDDLCLIFGSLTANGRYNRLDYSTNYGNEVLEISIEGMADQDLTSCDNSRTYWTPEMDRYFIDLMLHHVHKANKIDHTFDNEAWTDIITSFSAEFGSEYGEGVLRQQYKNLWKQFNDITNLLGQSGFSWDESQQMIIAGADDYICNTYIQEHPDMLSYINRTLPDYSDLCIIFRNAIVDGGNSCEDYADVNYDVIRLTNGEEIGSQASISDGSRTYWTPSMDHYFMDLLLEQVRRGNKFDYSFNKQAWMDMITLFKAKFGSQHDKDVLKSRYKNLRKQYNEIKNLLAQSGFTWDENRQMVTAEDDAWDAYLKAHPDARSYRTKTVLDYKKLWMIYGNTNANGKASHSGENADPKDDTLSKDAEGKDREALATCDRSRTYWTPPMDRYFIDLMLDQVHKGDRIGNTFNKQAWAHMMTCFNAKFGSQYDKDILRNRYNNLRKHYNYIKVLLNHNGFVWDEKRRMVTAADDVWEAYMKEHPDAQSYRTKILADYKDLCIIYDGRNNNSAYEVDSNSEDPVMKIDRASGGLQSSATLVAQRDLTSDVKESTPHSGTNKRPSMTPLNCQDPRKLQRNDNDGMQDAVSEMAVVVTTLRNQQKENENSISIENLMSELQAIPDMDEDLILDACDLLEDEIKAKTFLALDVKLRKKWLLRKLRP